MPGGQTCREELLGQLLIITTLHCTSAHPGTSVLDSCACKGEGGLCVFVFVCIYRHILCTFARALHFCMGTAS